MTLRTLPCLIRLHSWQRTSDITVSGAYRVECRHCAKVELRRTTAK